jgi:hypothetical protein
MPVGRRPGQPRRTSGSYCIGHWPADGSDDGPAPRTLSDMPRAGWLAILKRSVREFKHDDITDRAAALTY